MGEPSAGAVAGAPGTPFTPEGEPTPDFVALIVLGRERGWLSPDDLITVLQGVELSPALIDAVVDRVRAEGVEWHGDGAGEADNPRPCQPAGPARQAPRTPAGPGSQSPAPPEPTAGPAEAVPDVPAGRATTVPRPRASGGHFAGDGEVDEGRLPAADPIRLYLRQIGRTPLLSAPEEVELARRVEAGLAATRRLMERAEAGIATRAEAGSGEGVVPAVGAPAVGSGNGVEEAQLLEDERLRLDGLEAKDVLVRANLRLVVSIAKRYRGRGMAFLDLIQEGNLGLMRAVDKFDYSRGFKFSTYATWWIRQAISRAIADQARTIRIPVHMAETINRVVWAQRQLAQELRREPTVDEVAARAELTASRVRETLRVGLETVSLEQPLGEDDFTLSDVIEDHATLGPADAATRSMLNEAVSAVLEGLPARDRQVLRLRFGLDDGQVHTLEELGREFGVTRERIRQIESKTLAKLRNPARSGHLRAYLEDH